MKFVNVRKLHIDTAKVLAQASRGESIIVTNHGKPQALISPLDEDALGKIAIKNELLTASESTLKKDWLKPEEDEAWKNL